MPLRFIKCLAFTKKHLKIRFSLKKSHFYAVNDGNHPKFWSKKGDLIESYSVSERADDGLSSHACISISMFLTKTDFF
jgi:hypothetical protein